MEESYIGINVLRVMEHAKRYNESLVDLAANNISPDQKVLDFGAGIGTLSEIFRNKGFDVSCIETNIEETNILQSKGFKVYSDINSFEDNSLDNVVTYNVYEHIENDKDILKQVYNKLKKDGKLFIFVPAFQKLYSKFDESLGHVRRYEQEDFFSLLQSANFKIKEWHYFDSIGYLTALMYKHINNKGNINKKQVIIYDKIILPLSKICDHYFDKKFGKNIYAIATK